MKSDILFMGFYKQRIPREINLALWNAALLHVTSLAAPAFFFTTKLDISFWVDGTQREGYGCSR